MSLIWQVLRRAVAETHDHLGLNWFTVSFGLVSIALGFLIYYRIRDSDSVTDLLVGVACFSILPYVLLLAFNIWRGPYLLARDKGDEMARLSALVAEYQARRPSLELNEGIGVLVKDAASGRPVGQIFFKFMFKNRGKIPAEHIEGRLLIAPISLTGAPTASISVSQANPVAADGDITMMSAPMTTTPNASAQLFACLLHYYGHDKSAGDWYTASYFIWGGSDRNNTITTQLMAASVPDSERLRQYMSALGIDMSHY